MTTNFVAVSESYNMVAGSSWSTTRTVMTNRPEAVKVGSLGPKVDTSDQVEKYKRGSWRWERSCQVEVNEPLLGLEGFVAFIKTATRDHCLSETTTTVETVAGRQVGVANVNFGPAYAEWAVEMEGEAFSYLEKCLEGHGRDLHTLRFAAGVACCTASHDQRRGAWAKLVRAVWGDSIGTISRSVRTATVKVALRHGWKPSVPQPKRWEGLPAGVTEITPQ